jgi:DNA-binding NtrC family response regulator
MKDRASVLIVDDESGARDSLGFILEDSYEVITATSGAKALDMLQNRTVDVVLLDVHMPEMDGIDVLKKIKEIDDEVDVIMVSALDVARKAVEAMKFGAYDYITKPFEPEEILSAVARVMERRQLRMENLYLRREVDRWRSDRSIVGRSRKMREIFNLIEKVAPADSSVLISGESGTGKELVARSIHQASNRRNRPFVTINCAAIPSELMESEMFGHERGAFTGAYNRAIGRFEVANRGTIFLDEVATLRLDLQAKLLRVLQEREIERVGSAKPIRVDIRVIAATNTDLGRAVEAEVFRRDLFFRLNVVPIFVPALRDRREDIPILIDHFLSKYNTSFHKEIPGMAAQARETLMEYHWPGNIRELENLIERLVVLGTDGEMIDLKDIPFDTILKACQEAEFSYLGKWGFFKARDVFEKRLITQALEKSGWNQSEAARLLKIHRNTLLQKMKEFKVAVPSGEKRSNPVT